MQNKRRIYFIAVFLFIFLVSGELSIRVFLLISGKGGYVWIPDYYLGVIHAPNSRFNYTEKLSKEFNIKRKTNALGLIGEQASVKKPKNNFRIIVLGDSFTEGLQIEEGKNFCERLQNLLNKNSPEGGKYFEVLNAGVSGYSPISEYLFLKRELIKLSPDIVIQQIFVNDVFEDNKAGSMSILDVNGLPLKINKFFIKKYQKDRINFSELRNHFYKINKNVLNKSVLFQCVARAINKRYKKSPLNIQKVKLAEFNDDNQFFIIQDNNVLFQNTDFRDKAWEKTKKYILASRDLAKNNNARFFMFYIPPERQLKLEHYGQNCSYFNQNPNNFLNERLKELGDNEKFYFLDLINSFEENKDKKLYYNIDGHLTEFGGALVAEVLFKTLKDKHYVN